MERVLSAKFLALALLASGADAAAQPQPAAEQPQMTIDTEDRVARPDQWARACKDWDDWDKPAPPFRVHGNTFYVGTCGITVLFVAGENGTVMIDTGTETGVWHALRNVGRIGYDPQHIGLLLYSHEHFDHVGGMAAAQIYTMAPVLASPEADAVFRTGKDDPRDPQAGMHDPMRPAPHVIPVEPGRPVTFGGIAFTPVATPGHTPGALSWQWESCEKEVCKTIVYADSLSAISRDDYRFSDHPEYVAEFRAGLERLRSLKCDILLTPHPSASDMIARAATGSFEGGPTCAEYAASKIKALDERLAKEAVAK
ncbi:MBL fold metallo-hydrolase [Porphyrobacter sp. YT40]|nr:MBL fold metallo-hydrolase [Porphyrobacter sp. YT40]